MSFAAFGPNETHNKVALNEVAHNNETRSKEVRNKVTQKTTPAFGTKLNKILKIQYSYNL